jgi:hypothetical protein
MADCWRCDDQGVDCWVVIAVTIGKMAGEPYPRMHLEMVEVCPFCGGLGRKLEDDDG